MPTYEYRCAACGHAFEKFQSMSADPVKTCPSCGADQAERQISGGAGFIFKGGGFYETDYRSDAYKKSAEADKAPSGDAKADGNPDAKADAKPTETKASDAAPADKNTGERKQGDNKPAEAKPATPPPAPTKSEAAKAPPTPPPAGG